MSLKNRRILIDWLSDTCHKLSLDLNVFVKAVMIFDRSLPSIGVDKYSNDSLFLICITSLILALKLLSRKRISMEMASKYISKGKFNKFTLIKSEVAILKYLKFRIPNEDSFSDYSEDMIKKFFSQVLVSNKFLLLKTPRFLALNWESINRLSFTLYKVAKLDSKQLNKEKSSNLFIVTIFTCVSTIQHLIDRKTKMKFYKHIASLLKQVNCSYEKFHSLSKRFTTVIHNLLTVDGSYCIHLKKELEESFKDFM
jgi:hypothetical protein